MGHESPLIHVGRTTLDLRTPPWGPGPQPGSRAGCRGWVRRCRRSDSVNGRGVGTEGGASSVSVFVR